VKGALSPRRNIGLQETTSSGRQRLDTADFSQLPDGTVIVPQVVGWGRVTMFLGNSNRPLRSSGGQKGTNIVSRLRRSFASSYLRKSTGAAIRPPTWERMGEWVWVGGSGESEAAVTTGGCWWGGGGAGIWGVKVVSGGWCEGGV